MQPYSTILPTNRTPAPAMAKQALHYQKPVDREGVLSETCNNFLPACKKIRALYRKKTI